jgi:hypothetical protein
VIPLLWQVVKAGQTKWNNLPDNTQTSTIADDTGAASITKFLMPTGARKPGSA